MAGIVYDTLPSALPPNLPSLGYQATQTAEFGGLVQLDGPGLTLTTATVALSDWATKSTYETVGTSAGFNMGFTLNLYNVGAGNSVGALFATDTITAFVPWRPEASGGCPSGGYLGSDGTCYSGSLSTITFDLTGVIDPGQLIYGLAYNTQTWGYKPIGVAGPYDSLNFALSTTGPTVGSQPLPDTAYWNTSTAANYTDGGAAGVGVFRQDQGWTPYSGAIEFDATPEPASMLMLGAGLLAVGFRVAKRKA